MNTQKDVEQQQPLSAAIAQAVATVIAVPVITFGFVIALAMPVMLIASWMRMMVWNWFAPTHLHLFRMSYWEMFAASLLLSLFHGSDQPDIKPEYRQHNYFTSVCSKLSADAITLLLAFFVHLWILR
ncbi:MAG TPA: hypothetical protein VFW94_23465 [Candidatus Acidoferrales bacterium]|nr:hypothetical protein [Candidatus Acidoferrales bacterium]